MWKCVSTLQRCFIFFLREPCYSAPKAVRDVLDQTFALLLVLYRTKPPLSVQLRVQHNTKTDFMQVQNLWVCLLIKRLNISSQLISTKPPFLLTYLLSSSRWWNIAGNDSDTGAGGSSALTEGDGFSHFSLSLLWLRWWANSLALYLLTVSLSLQTSKLTT